MLSFNYFTHSHLLVDGDVNDIKGDPPECLQVSGESAKAASKIGSEGQEE